MNKLAADSSAHNGNVAVRLETIRYKTVTIGYEAGRQPPPSNGDFWHNTNNQHWHNYDNANILNRSQL